MRIGRSQHGDKILPTWLKFITMAQGVNNQYNRNQKVMKE